MLQSRSASTDPVLTLKTLQQSEITANNELKHPFTFCCPLQISQVDAILLKEHTNNDEEVLSNASMPFPHLIIDLSIFTSNKLSTGVNRCKARKHCTRVVWKRLCRRRAFSSPPYYTLHLPRCSSSRAIDFTGYLSTFVFGQLSSSY